MMMTATRSHQDAIAATARALSLTRRDDGPDVFQRLKIEEATIHVIGRRRRFMKMA